MNGFLSDAERAELADATAELASEQQAELDRRLDAYEADGNPGRPAEEVIADIRKRL